MDVHKATRPSAAYAVVTHRFGISTGGDVSSARAARRVDMPDIEIAPPARLPAVMELELDIDDNTRTVIGRIVNPETGEIVKQIPSEEMVRLMARNAELLGALLNKKA